MDIFLEKQFLFPPLYIRVQNMVKKEKKRKKKNFGRKSLRPIPVCITMRC